MEVFLLFFVVFVRFFHSLYFLWYGNFLVYWWLRE